MNGLYLHIPYCKKACTYCDFYFSTSLGSKDLLVKSLIKDIENQVHFIKSKTLDSVYFGGGTPSLLSLNDFFDIFNAINQFFKLSDTAEITIEMNPDDVTKDKLNGLKKIGFNRISLGVQTTDDKILQWMNRAHKAKDALEALDQINNSDFKSLSVDLIFGTPWSSEIQIADDLKTILSFQPDHISAYSLTLEEKTAYHHQVSKGLLELLEDELVAQQFLAIEKILESFNYEHYEVSNYALKGHRAKHNSSYWKNHFYIGIGPSANGFNGNCRRVVVPNIQKYVKNIADNYPYFEDETLTFNDKINERIMISLRLIEGLDRSKLRSDFNFDINENNPFLLQMLKNNWLSMSENNLCLQGEGKLYADRLASELFVV